MNIVDNTFWQSYRNIEKEVLNLSYEIAFTDDNLPTYSTHICDLILRCAIEIESISKAIYIREFDNQADPSKLRYDFDCIERMISEWGLDHRAIMIQKGLTSFKIDYHYPFIKIQPVTGKEDRLTFIWNNAYQCLKHNKNQYIKEFANIQILFNILAALYILNLYYRDEQYQYSYLDITNDMKLNAVFSSDIFYGNFINEKNFDNDEDRVNYYKTNPHIMCIKSDRHIDLEAKIDNPYYSLEVIKANYFIVVNKGQ